jgi:hypothetical protein
MPAEEPVGVVEPFGSPDATAEQRLRGATNT